MATREQLERAGCSPEEIDYIERTFGLDTVETYIEEYGVSGWQYATREEIDAAKAAAIAAGTIGYKKPAEYGAVSESYLALKRGVEAGFEELVRKGLIYPSEAEKTLGGFVDWVAGGLAGLGEGIKLPTLQFPDILGGVQTGLMGIGIFAVIGVILIILFLVLTR